MFSRKQVQKRNNEISSLHCSNSSNSLNRIHKNEEASKGAAGLVARGNTRNDNVASPGQLRPRTSSILTDNSEWILFSPENADEGEYLITSSDGIRRTNSNHYYYNYNEDDILSSSRRSSEDVYDAEQEYTENIVNDPVHVEDEEDDDSIINDLSNVVDDYDYEEGDDKQDLTTRIDNWRKKQVSELLNELNHDEDLDPVLNRDKLDLIQSWGIENEKLNTKPRAKKRQRKSKRASFYGQDLLSKYSMEDLKIIKQIVAQLRDDLDKVKHDKPSPSLPNYRNTLKQATSPNNQNPSFISYYSNYLTKNSEQSHNSKSTSGSVLNNPNLEKYLPLFLKNLLYEDSNGSHQHPEESEKEHFWDNDLKSVNSSILTLSSSSKPKQEIL
ncbi:BA75_03653T0 [Komagataella pastoris]|uniref:BA75_03653T0 n=1 Tax=Komagataella pastoris TaxID=4922 RepID=A0A1B2JF54_PICPA|nr:BA75_03653T0 [Komagataella pastoris]